MHEALAEGNLGLRGFVEQRLMTHEGGAWRARLDHYGRAGDPTTYLKAIRSHPGFADRQRALARAVLRGRNVWAHDFRPGGLNRGVTASAVYAMADLLASVGDQARSARVRESAERAGLRRGPDRTDRVRGDDRPQGGSGRRPRERRGGRPVPPAPRPHQLQHGPRTPPRVSTPHRSRSRLVPGMVIGALGVLVAGGFARGAFHPDPAQARYDAAPVGSLIGVHRGIDLSDGYHLSLLSDPTHPAAGLYEGDLALRAGSLVAPTGRIAPLDANTRGDYAHCRNDTRYASGVPASPARGRIASMCVVTAGGAIALVTIRSRHTAPVDYVTLDVTLWKGPAPSP
ncbi:MAG TPA: hypothetical protein VI248_14455 [Kineosporiaceae bacterium]